MFSTVIPVRVGTQLSSSVSTETTSNTSEFELAVSDAVTVCLPFPYSRKGTERHESLPRGAQVSCRSMLCQFGRRHVASARRQSRGPLPGAVPRRGLRAPGSFSIPWRRRHSRNVAAAEQALALVLLVSEAREQQQSQSRQFPRA